MYVEVEVIGPQGPLRRVRLKTGGTLVGRAPDCDVILPDPGVSRRHARLVLDARGLHLEDLGSGNGTMVAGERVQRLDLRAGDEIQIDPFVLRIHLVGPSTAAGAVAQDDTALLASPEATVPAPPQRGARLVAVEGLGLHPSYPIGPAGLSLGRSEEREVVLLDPAASRHQAEIREVDGVFWLRDHGSANGTFVNGRRVRERPLQHGDEIRVGATCLRFELDLPTGPLGGGVRPAAEGPGRAPPSVDPTLGHRRQILPASAPAPAPVVRKPVPPPSDDTRRLAVVIGVGVALLVLVAGAAGLATLAWLTLADRDAPLARAHATPALPAPPSASTPVGAPSATASTAPEAARTSPPPAAAAGSALDEGMRRFKEQDYLAATALFYKALKEDPQSLEAERMTYTSCELLTLQTLREDVRARAVSPGEREALLKQAQTQGKKALRTGAQIEAALQAVEAALVWYPQDSGLLELKGELVARRDGAGTASARTARTASGGTRGGASSSSASDRRLARQYLDEGLQAISDGRLVVARDRLSRALALDSSLSAARSNLADVDRILEDRANASWSQAQAHEAAGNTSAAIAAYELVVAYASSRQASLKNRAQQRIAALRG